MSHPDPHGPPDLTPIRVGEVWEDPVVGERGTILELPYTNPEGRATVELTALVGARVVGEHRHPALVERLTALEGELTVKRDGQTSILREGETAVVEPGVWHDWWNASDRDARVRVEITPGEHFAHMIETCSGSPASATPTPRACRTRCSSRCSRGSSATSSCSAGRRCRFNAQSRGRWLRSRTGAATARPTRSSHARCSRPGRSGRRPFSARLHGTSGRTSQALARRVAFHEIAPRAHQGCVGRHT
jgi:quercetin dioxygenase-like cupin family protein